MSNSQTLSDETINHYLSEFLGVVNNGYNLQKERSKRLPKCLYARFWTWWALVLVFNLLSLSLALLYRLKSSKLFWVAGRYIDDLAGVCADRVQ